MKKITLLFLFMFALQGQAQTYYSENFDTGLNGWITADLDGDTNEWASLNASSLNSNLGLGSLVSYSYTSALGPLTPDNLATSPAIDLTAVTASNVYFLYDQVTNAGYPEEHYAIYITTSNDPAVITAATPFYETDVTDGVLTNKAFNLSSFIGQTVYISFRHFNCTDFFYLIVDNMEVKSLPLNDIQLVSSAINRYGLVNVANTISLTLKNKGSNVVNNVTVNWNDGTDHSATIPTTIGVGETVTINHPTAVQYASVAEKTLAITAAQVNGSLDSNPSNNTSSNKFNTISQASVKNVLFEEGTGTWCGWCPRGAVAMNYMSTTYPDQFIGVAVHNGSSNPMRLAAYDTASAFSGWPQMNVDRVVKKAGVTQSIMVSRFNERKVLPTPVSLNATGSVVGSAITINASATFRTVFAASNFRLGVIISEDGVRGTTSGYNQVNYYAGGANGPMGGYESLPDPVPAAQMVYNHVGKALLGGYSGQTGSVPAVITDGQTANYTFNYTVPATSVVANMHAVLVLIDQATGEVVNAKSLVLNTLAVDSNSYNNDQVQINPNPASDYFNINNLKGGDYTITIYDMLGKVVQTVESNNVIENESVTIPVKGISTGQYIVNIASAASSTSLHLLVK
ncbi:Omp28-related outer membrane protein [Flavobacterium sp.]|uniref:T9SS type A sorting domain-containing protein n=1 Tax=Flavobacterium sp. TaxID=239 RepID=UPI003BC25419